MTRTSVLLKLALLCIASTIAVSQSKADVHGRLWRCFHCPKPAYSKLHTAVPEVYRLKAFLRKGVPWAYPEVWHPDIPCQSRFNRFTCPPAMPESSAEIYMNSIYPAGSKAPTRKVKPVPPKTDQKPETAPKMRPSDTP